MNIQSFFSKLKSAKFILKDGAPVLVKYYTDISEEAIILGPFRIINSTFLQFVNKISMFELHQFICYMIFKSVEPNYTASQRLNALMFAEKAFDAYLLRLVKEKDEFMESEIICNQILTEIKNLIN